MSYSRDELAIRYLDQLQFELYPMQEDALLAWFESEQGVLVCAPTGMGKTIIAEAALFEALHSGKRAYYTTPLIALTEQKFREMQAQAVRWGFSADDVGLVTGNRRENPDAKILVVVAEILFNRLLHGESFAFDDVSAVVMDEFHSFNDFERGAVWEFSLGLLLKNVRALLLSATVGNAVDFCHWLRKNHDRRLTLIRSDERKVPLSFEWIGERLLTEQIEMMAAGPEGIRMTPALVFCFNREECWTVAETLRGKKVIDKAQQAKLNEVLKQYDFSEGAGPKLRQILSRGIGVHHAGVLPKYRRVVEDLFQKKLLSIATCTETLSAGINLPARSVVLPTIMKGAPGKKRILDPSTAHQIFGRAGRPQFDDRGFVYVMAHEDDVKLARWRVQYDQIAEDTKDPNLIKMKKRLKKKMPKRRSTVQYWTEAQFDKLREAPPVDLASRGGIPWRLLATMLDANSKVEPIRQLVSRRLMTPKALERAGRELNDKLKILHRAGYVELEPKPLVKADSDEKNESTPDPKKPSESIGLFGQSVSFGSSASKQPIGQGASETEEKPQGPPPYRPEFARPTEAMSRLLHFRGVHPLYGLFLVNQLGTADQAERIQAMESVLELPGSVAHFVRVPRQNQLPPGPLATGRLDEQLLRLGLATADELVEPTEEEREEFRRRRSFDEEPKWVLTLGDKLRRLFDYDFPGVRDLRTNSVWAAGEVLEFGGKFNNYVTSKGLQKQEGMVFRHLLRLILLIGEFRQITPPETTEEEWHESLDEIAARLTETCQSVDPTSTVNAL
jgi:superfamily II DNA/RNA helicase